MKAEKIALVKRGSVNAASQEMKEFNLSACVADAKRSKMSITLDGENAMRWLAFVSLLGLMVLAASQQPEPTGEAVAPLGQIEPLPPVPKLPPHAIAIARLRLRESTLRVDPMSDFNLIRNVAERTGWSNLYQQRVVVSLDNDDIFNFPIVIFVSEHQPMNLTPSERERLRRYLKGGGFLFVSECSAKLRLRPELRPELQALLPESKLKPIPKDHPIYRVPYRIDKIVPARRGGKTFHEGMELDGRLVLVYSQNAEECSWQSWRWTGPMCACLPPEFEYAFRFGVNLVYYALTH